MSEEVPVRRTDLYVLVGISLLGGLALASWMVSPQLSPQFANAVFTGSMLLVFFLFIPVMGVRLFLEDRKDD